MQTEAMRSAWELYAKAWSNVGPDERQQLLRNTVAPSCVYLDPVAQSRSHAELAGVMEQFQRHIPGATIEVEGFLSHHDHALIHWRALDASGVVRLPGVDAVVFDADGLLVRIIGFFELPSA